MKPEQILDELKEQYLSGRITTLELAHGLTGLVAKLLLDECKSEFGHYNPGRTYKVKTKH